MAERVLVTGGCGFIGSHLVDKLVDQGFQVRVIDNLSTGYERNICDHLADGKVELFKGDIQDTDAVAQAIDGCNQVFHLAALADIVPSIEQPRQYYNVNVAGTMNVLEAARCAGVRKLIYAASSSCYGIPDLFPTPESAEIRPQYPYALTKWLGEEIVRHWGLVFGMSFVSLRLFNVYGPRSRTGGTYGAVFGVFLAQKLAGKPLTIVGDGSQRRDFTFVSDVVEVMVRAARSNLDNSVMNVGSGVAHSVSLLAELIGGDVVHIPKRPGEPDVTLADNSRITEELGWKPEVPLSDGVQVMLANIDSWRDAPLWDPESIAKATELWFEHLGDGQ